MMTFGHENLCVADLEASIRFYEQNFDLVLRKRLKANGNAMAWLGYEGTSFFLELSEGRVVRGNNHIAFVTDRRDEFFRRHNAAKLVDFEIPELDIYFMHDPDGNSIEVMSERSIAILNSDATC